MQKILLVNFVKKSSQRPVIIAFYDIDTMLSYRDANRDDIVSFSVTEIDYVQEL